MYQEPADLAKAAVQKVIFIEKDRHSFLITIFI